jgi:DNA (cytosine-5)-methyltransferase 1
MSAIAAQLAYPAKLDQLWREHVAPRAADAPTAPDVFSGTGGTSLGLSAAGFREVLACEWDRHACACFRLNHPHTPILEGDVAKLGIDDILARTGLKAGELDLFTGSPPCQGFSTAGKRQLDDDRNQLFREYVRLLRGLRPKTFIMENVSGMVKGKMKLIFAEILRALKDAGYRVRARLLNSMYFGVPQSRERMIFIGVRDDLGIDPTFPPPESAPVTVRQAWAGLPDQRGDALKGPALAVAAYVQTGTSNGGGRVSKWLRGTTSGFGLTRLSWNKPSCCIPKLSLLSSSPIIHPDRHERISIAQAQRLCSFPDQFQLPGDFNERWARLGNAVMPLFARAIALHVRFNILARIGVADG